MDIKNMKSVRKETGSSLISFESYFIEFSSAKTTNFEFNSALQTTNEDQPTNPNCVNLHNKSSCQLRS